MKQALILLTALLLTNISRASGDITYRVNPSTGAIDQINIIGDPNSMDWLIATDGNQYPWVTDKYGWGLGYMTIKNISESKKVSWNMPESISDPNHISFLEEGIKIDINRNLDNGELRESYTFTNTNPIPVNISDIGIYTPFNDNYPDAPTCLTNRANVHIWEGGNAAYVNAVRMGGKAPHLGVVVTSGAIKGYEIFERGLERQNSQQRGIFALKLPDMTLLPGKSYVLEWKIFSHQGEKEFREKAVREGCPIISCDKYVYASGDTAKIKVNTLSENGIFKNGDKYYKPVPTDNEYIVEIPMNNIGENRIIYEYDNGKTTFLELLVFPSFEKLIEARVNFIKENQQMKNKKDSRFGAYMVYDNEGDSIYLNSTHNCNPPDRDEGRERVGMGIMLAKYYQLYPREDIKESLLRYYDFLRTKLQDENYNTFSTTDHKSENRGYNYPWIANFYFQLYKITKDKKYAIDGYQTLQALFRHFGYGFYCIEMPVMLGLEVLQDAGLSSEYDKLKEDYIKTGDIFVENSINYPKHEVNYEQSIVAPAINFLLQIYQVTGDEKYLKEAERQLPILEAFNGFQPSYHLNDIAIRHWDDYWFGKSEMFGDTFPHYWSAGTGAVFYLYSQITGNPLFRKRAQNIVNNNLCLFTSDGRGYCAYIYPEKVDGRPGKFYDSFANDQDWALVYYFLVNNNLY